MRVVMSPAATRGPIQPTILRSTWKLKFRPIGSSQDQDDESSQKKKPETKNVLKKIDDALGRFNDFTSGKNLPDYVKDTARKYAENLRDSADLDEDQKDAGNWLKDQTDKLIDMYRPKRTTEEAPPDLSAPPPMGTGKKVALAAGAVALIGGAVWLGRR